MGNRRTFASLLMDRLQSSGRMGAQDRSSTTWMVLVSAAVFVFVAGIGAATSYLGSPRGSAESPQSLHSADGEALAHLKDYARSVGAEPQASRPAGETLLPDVNTMIERLAARLENSPDDVKGWRTLGWSYFHTARYNQAAAAYARAVALDPNSAELKLAFEEARGKASENQKSGAAAPAPTGTAGKGGASPSADDVARFEAMPRHDREAAIRSMVDGLASRLERSPHDVEGWTRLMRSRVVLGEREQASAVLRKALDVFKDDTTASGTITATALELGLRAQ